MALQIKEENMKIEIINSINKKDKIYNKIDIEMAIIVFIVVMFTWHVIESTGEFFKSLVILIPIYVTGIYCCFNISWGKKKFYKLIDYLLFITSKKENIIISSEKGNRYKVLKEEKNARKKIKTVTSSK